MAPPPTTQKALLVTEVGKPLSLTTTRAVPVPLSTQVQVRVHVVGVNPHDQKARDIGLFVKDSLPAVISNDVAGVITQVGSDVTNFSIGDRIVGQSSLGQGWVQNGLQEYVVLDEDFISKLPETISFDQAATVPTNAVAGVVALFDKDALAIPAPWAADSKGWKGDEQTLLVVGGGSNCGRLGVQLAALAGIGRIIVVGGSETELKSFGATHVIDRHNSEEEILKQIRSIVGDELLLVYDAINPPSGQVLGINALSSTKKGHLARLLRMGDIDESKIHKKEQGFELHNVLGVSHLKKELCKGFWANLPTYWLGGKIQPTEFEVVDLKDWDADKVNEVLDRYRDGKKVIKTHFHTA